MAWYEQRSPCQVTADASRVRARYATRTDVRAARSAWYSLSRSRREGGVVGCRWGQRRCAGLRRGGHRVGGAGCRCRLLAAARERGWDILVSDPLLVTPKTKTPGGAAVKGAGEGVAVKSNGVVVDGCEQPKLLSCELNCGMKLDPTSSRAEARLSGSAPLN